MRDKVITKTHRFIPRLLRRSTIRRKAVNGYPREVKHRVAKTVALRKSTICLVDFGFSPATICFSDVFFFACNSFRIKRMDKTMRSIPRQSGKKPEPAIRKVPIGILKESKVVNPPKRNIITPQMISSLFTYLPFPYVGLNLLAPLILSLSFKAQSP